MRIYTGIIILSFFLFSAFVYSMDIGDNVDTFECGKGQFLYVNSKAELACSSVNTALNTSANQTITGYWIFTQNLTAPNICYSNGTNCNSSGSGNSTFDNTTLVNYIDANNSAQLALINGIFSDNRSWNESYARTKFLTNSSPINVTSITIQNTTLDINEWLQLDGINQPLQTTSTPTFVEVTLTNALNIKQSGYNTTSIMTSNQQAKNIIYVLPLNTPLLNYTPLMSDTNGFLNFSTNFGMNNITASNYCVGTYCSNLSILNDTDTIIMANTSMKYYADTKALPGSCGAGEVVQNTTTNGVQCVAGGPGGSMVYPDAGIAISTGSGWNNSVTQEGQIMQTGKDNSMMDNMDIEFGSTEATYDGGIKGAWVISMRKYGHMWMTYSKQSQNDYTSGAYIDWDDRTLPSGKPSIVGFGEITADELHANDGADLSDYFGKITTTDGIVTGSNTATTDDLTEGSTNKYFNGKTTDDLTEGSTNKYFPSGGVSDTYDDGLDTQISFTNGIATSISTAFDNALMRNVTRLGNYTGLSPVSFYWNTEGLKQFPNATTKTKQQIGYTAQDVQAYYPQCVVNVTKNKVNYITFDRNCVIYLEINKIKQTILK